MPGLPVAFRRAVADSAVTARTLRQPVGLSRGETRRLGAARYPAPAPTCPKSPQISLISTGPSNITTCYLNLDQGLLELSVR